MDKQTHKILDGKAYVYRRENSRFWQCATFLSGRNHRQSTKETNLVAAIDFAREWYMEVYVADRRSRRGGVALAPTTIAVPDYAPAPHPVGTDTRGAAPRPRTRPGSASAGPSFTEAAEAFTHEYEIMTAGERNEHYVKQKGDHIRVHLTPFFGTYGVRQITSGLVQEYRVHRATSRVDKKTGEVKRPARSNPPQRDRDAAANPENR